MPDLDTLMAAITRHGEARIEAKRTEAEEFDHIANLAIKAHAAGAKKVDICLAGQISRPTLDSILSAHERVTAANRRKR